MTETQRWNLLAWTDQRTPALAIVGRGDQIRLLSPTHFSVCSQSAPGTFHNVRKDGPKWTCDCAFFEATKKVCVHVIAVRFREGLQESAPAHSETVQCDRCQSPSVIRYGVRHNKSGDVPTYLCQTCGKRFAGREGFHKRRADPEKIALALDLYFRGMSLRKIVEHFEQVHHLKVNASTVYRWIRYFSNLAAEWMDAQSARTGDRWHIDETVINVNGRNEYLWNVLDGESRFLLATHISHDRSLANTRAPLRKAKNATEDRPVDILSDGMPAYPVAIGKELGRKATGMDDPKHVSGGRFNPHKRVPSIRAGESNNKIERFHGTEKERTKVMRAFDNLQGASGIAEGFRVHYNLVREHQALGMTPGEAAGIPVGPHFRWKAILEAATRNATSDRGVN